MVGRLKRVLAHESPEGRENLQGSALDRFDVIAEELGLRIPCNVWTLDSKSGEFGLASCWTREDFEATGIVV
jgi:hypothetical protein